MIYRFEVNELVIEVNNGCFPLTEADKKIILDGLQKIAGELGVCGMEDFDKTVIQWTIFDESGVKKV